MAEGYDGDIKLSVGLDVSKTKFSLSQLIDNIKKAFSSSDPQIRSMGLQMQKLSDNIEKTKRKISELKNSNEPSEAFVELNKQIDDTAEKLVDAKRRLQTLKDVKADAPILKSAEDEVKRLEDSLDNLVTKMADMQDAGLDIKFDAEKVEAYEQKLGYLETQASIMNQRFDDATKGSHRFSTAVRKLPELVGTAFKKVGSWIKRHFVDPWHKSTDSMRRNLRQLLRTVIGIQALLKVLRSLRRYATDAFKAMAEQYPDINNQLSDTISSFNQFKNSVGTALQPLLDVVLPVLNTIISAFITAANAVGAFFAALTGQGFIYKATKQQENFAGAVGGVGGAAKEAEENLADYDKLLVISSNDAGGGGGGGGGGGASGGVFEKTPISSEFTNLAAWIKDMWDKADFTELGALLADKLVTALENIPWDKIKQTLWKIGHSIATFLNGLITPESLGALGTALAEALNSALAFARGFLDGYNWKNLGSALATGVTNFFRTADFAELGDVIHDFIAGALDAATTFFTETDFELIGEKIGEFFANLDIKDLVGKMYNLAKAILGALADAIRGFWNSADTTSKIIGAIALILGGLSFTGKLGTAASNILSALGGSMEGKTLSISKLLVSVATFEIVGGFTATQFGITADNLGFKELADEYNKFAQHPLLYTIEGLADIASFLKEDGFGKFCQVLGEMFSPNSDWITTLSEIFHKNPFFDTWFHKEYSAGDRTKVADSGFVGGHFKDPQTLDLKVVTQEDIENYKRIGAELEQSLAESGTRAGSAWALHASQEISGKEETLDETVKKVFKPMEKTAGNKGGTSGQAWIKSYNKIIDKSTSTVNNQFADVATSSSEVLVENYKKHMGEDVPKVFKDTYDKSANAFRNIGAWAKQKAVETSRGFSTLPADVSSKYNQAATQGKAQFNGMGTWATGVVSTVETNFKPMTTKTGTIFKQSYDFDIKQYDGIPAWAQSIPKKTSEEFSVLPDKTSPWFKKSYDNCTKEFEPMKDGTFGGSVASGFTQGLARVQVDTKNIFLKAMQEAQGQTTGFQNWFNKQTFSTTAYFGIDSPSKAVVQGVYAGLAAIWQDREADFTVEASADISEIAATVNTHIVDTINSGLADLYNKKVIKTYSPMPRIRGYATGAVIPPNHRFLAMLGDQTSGTNIETPLDTMVQAFEMALADKGGTQDKSPIVIQVDGRTLAQVVWDENEKRYKQMGRRYG